MSWLVAVWVSTPNADPRYFFSVISSPPSGMIARQRSCCTSNFGVPSGSLGDLRKKLQLRSLEYPEPIAMIRSTAAEFDGNSAPLPNVSTTVPMTPALNVKPFGVFASALRCAHSCSSN